MVMPSEIEIGVELERRAAGFAHALFDVRRQLAQVEVARPHFNPGVRDADERPFEVGIGEAGGVQHRPRRRPARAVGQRSAAPLEFVRRTGHPAPPLMKKAVPGG